MPRERQLEDAEIDAVMVLKWYISACFIDVFAEIFGIELGSLFVLI